MPEILRCSQCGAELRETKRGSSLCPSCALRLAIEPSTDPTLDLPRTSAAEGVERPKPRERQFEGAELVSSPSGAFDDRYRILDLLGEGGMGVVYRAEQREPVRREVAVKLIKLGMDTKQVLARFDSERQALALMDHPNIARVFDGGVTTRGRPYFVMEYVRGTPLTDFCNAQRLSTEERLRLFLQVCDGVQHAHRRGVIHRDLKPSNVLVQLEQDRPTPKIIDFGVAKAMGAQLSEHTLHTRLDQPLGTPEYMSPEQISASRLDVDTRTDVYSLGVVLYELLVGVRPFEAGDPGVAEPEDLRRRIRDTDPPRPSSRLLRGGEEAGRIASLQRTEARSLVRRLRGDLDWIVMKALEKEPTRRYGSVGELQADIERHLEDRPVLAGPPQVSYRLRKFVRRHAVSVAAAVVVLVTLLAGVAVATWQAVRATRAERRAVQEAETAQEVSSFLVELFRLSDPRETHGESTTAREILDRGAQRIDRELADRPLVRARLMHTIGTVYQNLGLHRRAGPLLEEALAIRREHLPGDALEIAESLHALGADAELRGAYEEARRFYQSAYEIRREALGPEARLSAESRNGIGSVEMKLGHRDVAHRIFAEILELWERELGPGHPDVARMLNNLSAVHWQAGDYARARPLMERALAIKEESLGPQHPSLAASYNNLGLLLLRLEEYEEARRLFERAVAIDEAAYGPDHPHVASGLNNLAIATKALGDLETARRRYERAVAIKEKALGPDSPEVAWGLSNLALLLTELGEYDAARALHERALRIRSSALGEEHPEVASDLAGLAEIHRREGRLDEARSLFERAIALREKALGSEHDLLAPLLGSYAALLRAQGERERAETLERRAEAIVENKRAANGR